MGQVAFRSLQGGEAALVNRSSRPASSPRQTHREVENPVEWLRRGMKVGAAMLIAELKLFGVDLAPSTIGRVLVRGGIPRLCGPDVSGGTVRVVAVRYGHPAADHLVHVDVKKLARIPNGGGWRVLVKESTGLNTERSGSVSRCSSQPRVRQHVPRAHRQRILPPVRRVESSPR